jgi:hypothetical protein
LPLPPRYLPEFILCLASKAAKEKASKLLGERTRNGLYRPLYNGLAIVTFGALVLYGLKLPNKELYRDSRSAFVADALCSIFFLALFIMEREKSVF